MPMASPAWRSRRTAICTPISVTTTGQPYAGNADIVQLNPNTGAIIQTFTISSSDGTGLKLDGLAYDFYTGNLFASSFTTGGNNLFEVNPSTGAVSKIGTSAPQAQRASAVWTAFIPMVRATSG